MPRGKLRSVATVLALGAVVALGMPAAFANETPKKGGTLKFVVPAEPPSYDGHRETTFALAHPIAPFYSLLIKANPDNLQDSSDFVCDLCTDMPKPTDGGKTYTFKLRQGVKFHDGTSLTSKDVKASFDRIIFPPEGVSSARKAYFVMVDKVEAPDPLTVQFKLKYPSGAFIPAVATPFNFIYSKAKLDTDVRWPEKNILGSGPFIFTEHQAGALFRGKANPDYYVKGRPFLDGFEAIIAEKESLRVQAIRGDRASIEFRGFPPKSRDELVGALGKDITVQESDWNCQLLITPNHTRKPFDDVRVRRALTLAVDRDAGSKYLSKIAVVRTVGGIVFPGHPLAATKEELSQIAGYWPDINKSRTEAKRLLKEAGIAEGTKFQLTNRNVDQPYSIVGTWLIDQWKQIGLVFEQKVLPTGPFYDNLRSKKDFDVTVDFNCQSVVNPLLDVSKFISASKSESQYGHFEDPKVDALFEQMNREPEVAGQRKLMREMERLTLDEHANNFITLWWYRIIPHRTYVKGWNISSSHYLNQDLSGVWLDQ
jgi:peptide/nickel transport system substrate-binding protein